MEVTKQALEKMRAAYEKNEKANVLEPAIKNNGIHAVAEREVIDVNDNPFVFSIDVDKEAVANQRQSGRCWMYACMNFLRWHIEKKLDLPHGSFELSQTFPFFYDRLEKSNAFMEYIVENADALIDDRRNSFLFTTPQSDGGDWEPIVALVKKYGVVPLNQMPDTAPSKNTSEMDALLNRMLREDGWKLREMVQAGKSKAEIDKVREEMLGDIYRVTAMCFGVPPEKFDFEYRDAKNVYHVDRDLTPLEFYQKYLDIDLDDYIGVLNYPVPRVKPYQRYFIEMSNEVFGVQHGMAYVAVEIEDLKNLAIAQLKGGEPVWFACDVTQDADFQKGILSDDLYDMEALFDITWEMDKGQWIQTDQSTATHAMMLAGVDLDADGKPIRWKVENSWGTENGGKPTGHSGYFIMDDTWFDSYMYQVAINKKYFDDKMKAALATEPEALPFYNTLN